MKTVRLGELMPARAETLDPRNHPDEQFDLFSIPSHDRGRPDIVRGHEVGSPKQIVHPGDVVVSKIVPHIRRASVIGGFRGRRQIASGEWIVLRNPSVEPRYLRSFLVSDDFHARFMSTVAGVGGSLLRARPAQVRLIEAPLPSLEEQRRIAAVLDHADTLRAKQRQVLDYFDALTQSIFHEMFAGLSPEATVEDIALKVRTGPFGSQLLHSEFVDAGVAVLGLDNVVSNEFAWTGARFITDEKYADLKRYTVDPGDVLISIMGTTGRCVVVPDGIPRSINSKHLCAITPDHERAVPEYLQAAFLWDVNARRHLQKQTKGSIMSGLNMGIIKSMPIPLPPLTTQQAFRDRIAAASSAKADATRRLKQIDELFASLQSRAFRGEL